jgi:hypothetical protein
MLTPQAAQARDGPAPAAPSVRTASLSLTLFLALSLSSLSGSLPAVAEDLVYIPRVAVVPEVRTPQGELRTYRTGIGYTYWRADLPIYKGDRVRLNIFACSGGVDLAEARVRLDNVEIHRITEAPWCATLETGDLSEGYHFVEAWVRTAGPNPRTATDSITLFIEPHAAGQTPIAPAVETIQTTPRPVIPDLPPSTGGPSVALASEDPEARQSLQSASPVRVAAPVIFSVTGPGPGQGFSYGLYRAGHAIYRSQTLAPETRIILRPDATGAPGLLPGLLMLVVRGVNAQGQLGPPLMVDVEVPSPPGPARAVSEEIPAETPGAPGQ